ncbi:MAG TPA: PilC/PilY family type IV pilus protein [Candidatus Eisenbacteria bacterium]|nr:PilC/PilY family type IV pilus protein [Candidatus Eisenbacteria bacterium]
MRRAIAILQVICILFWNVPLANTDDSDIFGTNVEPNVLILLDSSGSMEETIFSSPYDPDVTYNTPLTYTTTNVYRKFTRSRDCRPAPAPCYKLYASSISDVSSSSARDALSTSGYWSGRISGSTVELFYGNYLNYLACSSCSIQEEKIVVAKRVVNDLINNIQGVRFGVMRFNSLGTTGQMVATIGTDKATIISAVNNIEPSGNTPLGEQMDDAGRYFKGQTLRNGTSYSSPIQYSCQPNFVIVISDGKYNGSVNPKTEATNRYTQDHSSYYAGTQNVIVHTVGLDLDPANAEEQEALDDLEQMAINGGGSFVSADTSTQLQQALQNAISQIMAATFSFATPVVPTTGTSGSNRAYLAAFQSNPTRPFWRGYLKAYDRDANGLIPVDGNGLPLDSALAWDAGQELTEKSPGSRNIYTYVSGARQDFTTSNSAITPSLLNAADNTEKNKIINFTRGIDSYDEDVDDDKSEERQWKLGDIFHSTPVIVSPPFLPSNDASYTSFKTANASRATVLIAGSNDGMLHAFRESDGAELWAFAPPDVLDSLKDIAASAGQHAFYVDASPLAADVKIGSSWKTIVIFGQRRGGRNYYALDITDTTNPQYLWSFTDSKMGETWSDPVIGKVKMADNTSKYVAFIGGGYDTTQNNATGKAFFAIDLSNGAKLWEYYNPGSVSDDRQYMNFSLAASPTAVDLNADGYTDRVYIGDVGGQLWKFDVNPTGGATVSGGLVTNWTGKRLFRGPSQANPPPTGEYYPAQAIYVPPSLAYDSSYNLWVYFGTGDRNHPNNTSSNRFYGIQDNTSMTNGSALTEASLTNVTSGGGSVSQGWYIVLNNNEKVLSAADVFNSAVFFTTFTPTTTVACGGGGGDAKLYAVNLTTGDAAVDLTTGAVLTSGQSALTMAKAIGTGIPSKPIIIINQAGNIGNPYVITGTTNQQISNTQIPQVSVRRLVGWREVF